MVTREVVWDAVEDATFAVLSWVNDRCEPRSAGVVYTVHERHLYVATDSESWKARQIAQHPAVAVDGDDPDAGAIDAVDQGARSRGRLPR